MVERNSRDAFSVSELGLSGWGKDSRDTSQVSGLGLSGLIGRNCVIFLDLPVVIRK